jgi:phage repressor protein C with HTH and peptisase S24 domain
MTTDQAYCDKMTEVVRRAQRYGVIENDGNSPRYAPGDTIYIDPDRPVKVGDDVVAKLKNGADYVGRLDERTAKRIKIGYWNARYKPRTIAINKIRAITSITMVSLRRSASA